MIGLLTRQHDLTADLVVRRLQQAKHEFVRINVDRLLTDTWLEIADATIAYTDESGCTYDLSTLRSIWYRTHERPAPSVATESSASAFAGREALAELFGALLSTDARWINHPAASWSASQKPWQLHEARRCGLRVPRTLITRRPEAARAFVRSAEGSVIAKAVSYGLVEQREGSDLALYTTRLPHGYDNFDDVALAPVILQDEIAKRSDLRVTVVDDDVFAVSIDSQGRPETTTDWRRSVDNELPMCTIELPSPVKEACLRLLRVLGLRFGAVDFIHSCDDEYYFLEVNPTGQWGWLEVQLGVPISASIAAALAKAG